MQTLINLLLVFVLLLAGDVLITVDAPSEVEAGSEFIVSVTISKNDSMYLARYLQELPIGVTAKVQEPAEGTFYFEFQNVKIIWGPNGLPPGQEFTIMYTVHVNKSFSGEINFGGMFTYSDEAGKRYIAQPGIPKTTIVKAGTNEPEPTDVIVTNNNLPAKTTTGIKAGKKLLLINDKTAKLTIKINKSDLSNFMKYSDSVPEGCEANAVETGGGIFTVEENTYKVVWNSLPADSVIKVVILITSKDNGNLLHLSNHTGEISYMDGEGITTENLAYNNENKEQFIEDAEKAGYHKQPMDASSLVDLKHNKNLMETHNSNNISKNSYTSKISKIPEPETWLKYKVQICALLKYRNARVVKRARRYSMNDKVELFSHQGWYKYTVGDFVLYNQAREYREKV
ncbi:MAG: hypothetical protein HY738_22545 [Bacteroidia bacterium]|nr:hypothetical protein [Bacteroidia bacterium]